MRGEKLVLQRAKTYVLMYGSFREVILVVALVVPLGAACLGHPPASLAKVLYVLGTRHSSELSRRWYASS